MIDKNTAKDIFRFSVAKDIKYLFKYLLEILDDLERDGAINQNNKDFFRKKVLSQGNDALRNLDKNLDKFDIDFIIGDNKL